MPPDLPEIEIDPITGKPRQAQPGQNSLVYQPLNRKLLYTKSEVDALLASVAQRIPSSSVPDTRMIMTEAPLSGGGDLSADRSITTSISGSRIMGRGSGLSPGTMQELLPGNNVTISGLYINTSQDYNTFVYKSTGVQTYPFGNRFNSWPALMAVLQRLEGAKTIQFEQDETIPPGSYNLDNVTLKGNGQEYNAGGYTLTFGDNTTISSWINPSFNSLLLKSTSTTGHICTFSYAFSLLMDTVSNIQSSSSYEFFNSTYAGQNIIAIRNSARFSLVGGSTKALFKFSGGAFTQQVIISRGEGAVLTNNTLSSTNAQILIDIIANVNGNLANYPIANTSFTTGFFLPLALTNVSALAFYTKTLTNADSPYTVKSEDGYLRCDAAAGAITLVLPTNYGLGRLLTVKKIDNVNNVTISGTIDGATSKVLTTQYESVQIIDATTSTWDGIT